MQRTPRFHNVPEEHHKMNLQLLGLVPLLATTLAACAITSPEEARARNAAAKCAELGECPPAPRGGSVCLDSPA